MLSDQLVKQRDPGQTLRQPLPDQQPPGFVFDLNVVMGLSPIVADEQHPIRGNGSLGRMGQQFQNFSHTGQLLEF
jgi:hypothetical protein